MSRALILLVSAKSLVQIHARSSNPPPRSLLRHTAGSGSESTVSAPVPMDRPRRCPRFDRLSSIALFLLILLASNSSLALAQMLLRPFRKDEDASWEGVVSLDQTGLGLFDAFFASFSMIIVSEVS
ncbi:hypothetical protein B296_00013802 [Ensete ventricosum]|uniref:CASP-like protein n=1 Tax=Ensete ventricosum TaxID=4639 RepID=A0A427AT28_ENSVE|nr:hypothetical protein B296_00013802 [Ensete ventricosum]